jgi:hypothetical protein
MGVIERLTIYRCPKCRYVGGAPMCAGPLLPHELADSEPIEVVPASALEGAVDLLGKAYDALNRAAYVGDPTGAEMCDSVMAQIRGLRGGQ